MPMRIAILAVVAGFVLMLAGAGCAPLRDQNGHPILDKKGNEEYHRTI